MDKNKRIAVHEVSELESQLSKLLSDLDDDDDSELTVKVVWYTEKSEADFLLAVASAARQHGCVIQEDESIRRVSDNKRICFTHADKKLGWYSETAAHLRGVSIYLDTKGNEVGVTLVEPDVDKVKDLMINRPDLRLVGEVTTFVKKQILSSDSPTYYFPPIPNGKTAFEAAMDNIKAAADRMERQDCIRMNNQLQ